MNGDIPPVLKLCAAPGCDALGASGAALCPDHLAAAEGRRSEARARAKVGEAARAGRALYATERWKRAARRHLAAHPLCADCAELGAVTEASEVDHVVPHRGDRARFWDRSNWQSLCRPCHSRKTAGEVWHGRRKSEGNQTDGRG